MGLFDRFKKKPEAKPPADDLVAKLETLGYFAYTDPHHIQQLKTELARYLPDGFLPQDYDDDDKGIDPRHYTLDNEDLFEGGGITDSLQEMAPLFAKMNIPMDISDHYEEWIPEKGLDHRITLNGKPYTIFHQWDGYGWGEAAQRFADIVNDQLAIHGSNERLYLIHGGNDGRAVFLTPEQHALILPLISDRREQPMLPQQWCDFAGVSWENVTG